MFLTSSIPVNAQTVPPQMPPQLPQSQYLQSQTEIDVSTPSQTQPDQTNQNQTPRQTTISVQEAEQQFTPLPKEPFPGPMCIENNLSPKEADNIFNLLKDGFLGEELSGDADPEKTKDFQLDKDQRKELGNNKLVIENPSDESKAAKAEVPTKEANPYEVSNWINTYVRGPFAFGLVLDDTLRTGRCKDTNTAECYLVGKNLKLRNDGTGIVANAKPIKDLGAAAIDKIAGLFSPGTNANPLAFSGEEQEAISAGLFTEEESSIKAAVRLEKELIANSIFTKEFDSKMGTNCTNDDCVISTYSMFDKYFNQWLSSEMVATTFGPSLLGRAKKLFNWVGRRGTFLKGSLDAFRDKFRSAFEGPGSFLGKIKLDRMMNRLDKHGWKSWWQDFMGGNPDNTGYPFVKTFEFQSWWGKMQDKGGFLDSIDTVEKKAEFIRVLKDLRTYTRATNYNVAKVEGTYKEVVEGLIKRGISNPYEHPEGRKALIEYGREFGKMIQYFDDDLGLDGPDWFVRHPNVGLFNKGVRQVNTGEVIDLFQEHRNYRVILNKFVDSGNWKNFENESFLYRSAYETDGAGNLVLYAFDPSTSKLYGHIEHGALTHQDRSINNLFAKLDDGTYMRVTPTSGKFIMNRTSLNVDVYQGNWAPYKAMTPEEFAMRLTNARVRPNFTKAHQNVEQMLDTLKERNWISRRYWNALDKLMAQEDELIRNYFTLRGGFKWTAYPFGYWWAKKGFGLEGFSNYQLPDKWSYLFVTHKDDEIFDYSYIDFFANAGSDQGDLFVQVLNKLPWDVIYEAALESGEKYIVPSSVTDLYRKVTEEGLLRNEVENIAFYLTGPQNCDDCSLKIESNAQFEHFRPFFVVKNTRLTSYILEDTQSEEARKQGTTLIAFAHRTNLAGKSGEIEGEKIDLAKTIREEAKQGEEIDEGKEIKSCREAIRSLPLYSTADKMASYLPGVKGLPEDEKIAAVFGGVEALAYVTFFWPGVFTSVAIQTLYAPKLQDCIDTEEGYFIHYFLGAKDKEKKEEEKGNEIEKSTQKVSGFISKLKDSISGAVSGDTNSYTKEKVAQFTKEAEKLVKDAEEDRIVQARLNISGNTAAQLKGVRLFYFWCGKGCERLGGYRTKGVEKIDSANSDDSVLFDFEKGVLSKNGEPIVTNPDAVRLTAVNTGVPAHIIPRRLNQMCVAPTEETAIEIMANGVANVQSPEIRNCLADAVMAQTGLPLGPNNDLSNSFGLVKSVSTTTHPNIAFLGDQIIAEGIPRKIATNAGATLKISNNKKTRLSHSNDGITETGTVKDIFFETAS